jgi:hypothetical protein
MASTTEEMFSWYVRFMDDLERDLARTNGRTKAKCLAGRLDRTQFAALWRDSVARNALREMLRAGYGAEVKRVAAIVGESVARPSTGIQDKTAA